MTVTRTFSIVAAVLCPLVQVLAPTPAAAETGGFPCTGVPGAATPAVQGVPDATPETMPYHRLSWQDTALNLGIGHLRPVKAEPFATDWYRKALLPLFDGPNGVQWGWLAKGWLVDHGGGRPAASPLGTGGMIETGYETPSLIVLEAKDDGWLRFRWDVASASRGGTAWVHRCHLDRAAYPIRFQTWDALFREADTGPLFFRNPVRHSLRAGPGADRERLGWIVGEGSSEYHLEPVQIDGDWMRVRVTQPSDHCAEPGAVAARISDGWIKWRSPEQGPWIWYHTRGC